MTYYSIIEVTVIDQSLMASYFTDVPAIVAKHGGVYKARTANHEQMEGEPRERPQLRVILEWPSKESVMAFRDSPEYQPYFENRLKGAKTVHILVEGQ
eukprot:CAMPEP_0198108178 /NCGR_PEP_ID=MMETSP1442-20131203/267_1 /TAXON_ID= /ORGANISM="Craspedostauros australis, Strain CCMP3328" /LENGTH=97 /DNA_ID=CAMNT_0043763401 /DNA_START=76 /DNA_END=369 /DNA_ORIENTATION=+